MRLPMTDPAMATAADSQSVRPNPNPPTPTRRVPAANTRSPAPRLDHNTKRSKVRRTRSDSGTGSTPHSGGSRRRAIARSSPPGIYRVGRARGLVRSGLFLGELLVRMPQGGHERKLLSGEEVDQGAAARAHMIDFVLEAEPFDRSDRMASADHRQSVRFCDRREEFSCADRERLELED